jgi:hypothetical protein
MKNLLTLCLLLCLSVGAFAQTEKGGGKGSKNNNTNTNTNNTKKTTTPTGIDKDAQDAATDLCTCVNETMGSLHPAMIEMIQISAEKGEAAGEQYLTDYLIKHPTEMGKIMEDAQKMESLGTEFEQKCDFKQKYSRYDNNQAFEDKLIANLSSNPECKLAHTLMLLGLKEGDE